MNSFILLDDNNDPNKTKNRIPTDRERQFIHQLICAEERKLTQIDVEVHSLNIEITNTQCAVQEYQSLLLIAYELVRYTEAALKAAQNVSEDFAALRERSESWSPPEASPRAMYEDMVRDKFKLEKRHADDFLEAREDFARASTRVYELEEELDATRSMLAFTYRSMKFLTDLKGRVQKELRSKKDLVGPRRRVPAELWAQIFRERLDQDEEEFHLASREGTPPFTTLRLSWVCKFWRVIAHSQPNLWQYIAIPRAVEMSRSQWDRVQFYRSLAKALPPIVYVAPESRGVPGSTLRADRLLQSLERFKKLELRVSRRTSEAEDLLAALAPNVEELVLIGTFKAGTSGTSCPLKYGALVNVQKITCMHLQPSMRSSSPNPDASHLTAASFIQNSIDPRSILQFLDSMPTIEEVKVDLLASYSSDGDAARTPVTLPGVKRISGFLDALCALFTQGETLPNLEHVTLQNEGGNDKPDSEIQWSRFLGIHSRAIIIHSLTLGTFPLPSSVADLHEAYARIVQQLPHLRSLHLMEDAGHYALEGMTITKNIPAELHSLRLSSIVVTEDHVAAFLRYFHTTRRTGLELFLFNCPGISEASRERLAKLNTM